MIRLKGDLIILKIIQLLWSFIVTSKRKFSWVTSLENNGWLSMTSVWTSLVFYTYYILWLLTNSSSKKQVEVLKSIMAEALKLLGPKYISIIK